MLGLCEPQGLAWLSLGLGVDTLCVCGFSSLLCIFRTFMAPFLCLVTCVCVRACACLSVCHSRL